jgi:D-glycero-D-manno-heptose 1,7-bisphosphate phosphatase
MTTADAPLRCAVFIDRDGVINRSLVVDGKPLAPRRLADFRLLPGVKNAVARLREAGFVIVVVTNQPDIGNKLVDDGVVAAMHERVRRELHVDAIGVCPHRQDDGCDCRKPQPGMLLNAARRLSLDLAGSYMVGDRGSDIAAARNAGCYAVLVKRGYSDVGLIQPDIVVGSLAGAARVIIERSGAGGRRCHAWQS